MEKLTLNQIVTEDNRDNRGIPEGIFDVSNIEEIISIDAECFVIEYINKKEAAKIVDFCNKYSDWCVGEAYEVGTLFLLSSKPPKFTGRVTGAGFNYGSANLLEDCPSKLLILAAND